MPLIQSIDFAREDRAGEHGVSAKAYDDALKRSADALASLRKMHADKTLRLLQLPAEQSDLAAITDAGRKLSAGATDIVILGTGGSSLGGQTLAQLADYAVPGLGALRAAPRMHFMDNLDPQTFGGFLEQAAARDHAFRLRVEIRRHRRDLDADHRGARRGEGREARCAHP